jgi:hypothetical protein
MDTFEANSRKKDFSHEISDQRSDESSVSRKLEKLHSGVNDKDLSFTRVLARATVVVERIETDRTRAKAIIKSRKHSQKCGFFFLSCIQS